MFYSCCIIGKIFADGNFLKRKTSSGSEADTIIFFPRDIHGSPIESLIVRVAEVIGSFKNPRKMALFWRRVVTEVSGLYKNEFLTINDYNKL